MKGQIVSGDFGKVIIRQKSDNQIEIGELLVADDKVILQAYDSEFGSQISQQQLELISGLQLEEGNKTEFFDKPLRNYNLTLAKPVLQIGDGVKLCKTLPKFFSLVREIKKEDLKFLSNEKGILLGNLRSGSKTIDVNIYIPQESLTHHILIPATTGRGKSNLVRVILWNIQNVGVLVLDPHDEYYGRTGFGLRDKNNVVYYTPIKPPSGTRSLVVNIAQIKPNHFKGVVNFSDPQKQCLNAYYKQFGTDWIKAIVQEEELPDFQQGTLSVVRRTIMGLLDLSYVEKRLTSKGMFDFERGETTITDICRDLESEKIVIVDTSIFSGTIELLVSSLITNKIFNRYKKYKRDGLLEQKPIISIVLEEAPRVIGKEVLAKGTNIFGTIAREGRKFNVGLIAITQLPSLIPREILANMNTKIILGLEMGPERQAIIESASQDLSNDSRNIASLDKGEAIVTSTFTKFAIPIKIPDFRLYEKKKSTIRRVFSGIT